MRKATLAGLGAVLAIGLGCAAAPDNDGSAPVRIPDRVANASPPATSTVSSAQETSPEPPPSLPADKVYEGRGDKIVKLTLNEDYLHIAAISHTGRSNFVVTSLDEGGDYVDLVVNEIGRYTGVRPIDFEETAAALEIKADGAWKVTVKVAQKAPRWPAKASGKGDAVLLVDPDAMADGFVTVNITHKGASNFVVTSHGGDWDLLVNDIGNYRGEVIIPDGAVALEIVADGSWTITRS